MHARWFLLLGVAPLACSHQVASGDGAVATGDLTGVISVFSTTAHRLSTLDARFYAGPPPPDIPYRCTGTTIGPCVQVTCAPTQVDLGAPFVGLSSSAGPLQLSGGQSPFTLVPDAHATYPELTKTTSLFRGGETLTAAAKGADVPPFSVQLTAPSEVTLTAPPSPNGVVDVQRSAGLAFTWVGGGAGQLVIMLLPPFGRPTDPVGMTCQFPAAAGAGTIPAAALTTLPQGGGTIDVSVGAETKQGVGAYTIRFVASTSAFATDGTELAYVNLQ
jgi:hypothetical protein